MSSARLKKMGFRVSLFADGDGDAEALTIAKAVGADRIELYTGPYGGCFDDAGAGGTDLLEALGRTADARPCNSASTSMPAMT